MNIKTLLLIFLSLTSSFIIAQVQHSADLFYGRYEGELNEELSISTNLISIYNQISGNFQVLSINNSERKFLERSVIFTGQHSDDSIRLSEFGSKSALAEGTLNTSQLNGYWTLSNGQVTPFVMQSSYPMGSLAFDVSYLRSEFKLDSSRQDSPTASIELTLVYPKTDQLQPEVIDSVMHHINDGFFGHGLPQSLPDSLLLAYEEEYYNNYKKQNEQWLVNGGHSFSWEKAISTSITFNSNHLLCLEFERYAYTGGAHGMSNIAYQIIDLQNGSLLTYSDLFGTHSDSLLTKLLTDQLKTDRQIPSDSSLKSAGYFVDEINPNHNIFIEASGIGFTYNSYEIAPYSFGSTSIFLKFDQFSYILKPDSPLHKTANSSL